MHKQSFNLPSTKLCGFHLFILLLIEMEVILNMQCFWIFFYHPRLLYIVLFTKISLQNQNCISLLFFFCYKICCIFACREIKLNLLIPFCMKPLCLKRFLWDEEIFQSWDFHKKKMALEALILSLQAKMQRILSIYTVQHLIIIIKKNCVGYFLSWQIFKIIPSSTIKSHFSISGSDIQICKIP